MKNTIWGEIQHEDMLADGVLSVDTASHGGIVVDDRVANRYLSKEAKHVASFDAHHWYFEEDCDWAVFAFENPSIVPQKWLQYVLDALNSWNVGYIEAAKKSGNYEKRLLNLQKVMGQPVPTQMELFN